MRVAARIRLARQYRVARTSAGKRATPTPKAFASSSPGLLQPWETAPLRSATLKAFANQVSIPNVPFVVFDSVRVEKRSVFILKRDALVMLFLIFDVRDHVVKI